MTARGGMGHVLHGPTTLASLWLSTQEAQEPCALSKMDWLSLLLCCDRSDTRSSFE
ncbi:MAG TPA: hypothetical protein VIW80_09435 [Pyrinomonadaceae bacterium]